MPGMLSNEELVELISKAAVSTATGGQLSSQQTDEFLDLVVDQTPILQQMRVETGVERSLDVDGIEFGESIIVAGVENTDPSDAVAPSMPRLTLTPKEIVATVDISFNWLRQNIRREAAEADLQKAIAKRFGMDLLDLIFNGDTTLDTSTRRNKALRILNGILKKANADATVKDDVVAANPTFGGAGGEFSQQLALLPKQYRDDRGNLVHVVSQVSLDKYEDEIASRQTAAADNILFGANAVTRHKRVDIVAPFGFPDGSILTTHKRNLVVAFGRQMQFYKDNNYRKRQLEMTIVVDMDCGYVFGNAVVLGQQA